MNTFDKYIISNSILPYLSYQDAIEFGCTNQKNRESFQIAKKNEWILPLSSKMIFRKIWNSYSFSQNIFCQIISVSYSSHLIEYQFIPYGYHNDITYPVYNKIIYYLSQNVIYPNTNGIQKMNYVDFKKQFNKTFQNTRYVYSFRYFYPFMVNFMLQSIFSLVLLWFSLVFSGFFLICCILCIQSFFIPNYVEDSFSCFYVTPLYPVVIHVDYDNHSVLDYD
jgi:hypothetical protein